MLGVANDIEALIQKEPFGAAYLKLRNDERVGS